MERPGRREGSSGPGGLGAVYQRWIAEELDANCALACPRCGVRLHAPRNLMVCCTRRCLGRPHLTTAMEANLDRAPDGVVVRVQRGEGGWRVSPMSEFSEFDALLWAVPEHFAACTPHNALTMSKEWRY